jgi:hypothetical protein
VIEEGTKPGSSGSVARNSDHWTTVTVIEELYKENKNKVWSNEWNKGSRKFSSAFQTNAKGNPKHTFLF